MTTSINVPAAKTYLEPGQASTCRVGATPVTAKRFVKVGPGGVGNHPVVIHATAGGRIYGVAHFGGAVGAEISVLRQGTFEVTAGANLTAGQEVEVGANGVAIVLASGSPVGVVTADTANGNGAPITLY